MRLKKSLAKIVARERVCRIATVGKQRAPQVVPVCHVLVDGKVYFATDRKAKKVQNLRASPHATVTVDTYSEDWSSLKGVMLRGTTALIEGGPRFRKIRKALYEKYPQYPEEAAIGERDSIIVEVTPTHASSWGTGSEA
jgi:nitroimidazol reductase NimA-like FMN-containing flavoprotein (pyridoxamine 5'-phosphate oxidase superfamily)